MKTLQQILNGFNLAQQAIQATAPHVAEWGSGDHQDAVTGFINVAGATVSAADPAVAPEVAAATAVAGTIAPMLFNVFKLFKKL